MEADLVRDVLREHERALLGLSGVQGVGEGRTADGVPCIVLFVARLPAPAEAVYPSRIGGHPVIVRVAGPFEAR